MRRRRKLFAGLLSLALALGLSACSEPAPDRPAAPDTALSFRPDGGFRLMSISDIQDGADVSPDAIQLISMALDAEKPDMVVLLGDNIFDWSMSLLVSANNVKKSIDTFTAPIIERHIPFAVVFGNHDQTVPFNKEAQWNYYQSLGALGTMNKIDDRIGNYNLVVNGTDGQPALNLWFFDSGGSTFSSQGTQILPEQLQWYTQASDQLKDDNGGTVVPAVAFRVFKSYLEKTVGVEEARKRIYVTTDKARGTLKGLADREGYETFVVPDDVGGRFSVLTAVGLLPIAAAGCDIDALMAGAKQAMDELCDTDLNQNDCYRYAAARNLFLRKGRSVEMMVNYEPSSAMMAEWWKQLYGESEGKDGKGLFPASAVFSTDLHSLGQFVQDGSNLLFETVLLIDKPQREMVIEADPDNVDGLNFLAGKTMGFVNEKAFEGTVLAHADGDTPTLVLRLRDAGEQSLGYLIYFFEKACAVSGYLLGVNPFDQPGVESYKKNMFALLGKPGFEAKKASLEARLG